MIAARYARGEDGEYWFDELKLYSGAETPSGRTVAGLVVSEHRDHAPIHLDVIGVGASPYDVLCDAGQPIYGINVAERATRRDRSGRLDFSICAPSSGGPCARRLIRKTVSASACRPTRIYWPSSARRAGSSEDGHQGRKPR